MTLEAAYPIALLPVRLETRFSGALLQVRIFPDDIWADTHETGLTADERADGNAYLAAKAAGSAAEQSVWATLVGRWTAPRAAYIVEAVAAGSTESRAESWTRAAQASLPEQWIVRAYQGSNVFTATSSPVRQPLALTLSPSSTPADRFTLSDGLAIDTALQWTVDFAAAQAAGMAVTIDLSTPDPPGPATADPSAGVDLLVVIGISDTQSASDGASQLRALLDAQHYTRGLAFLRPGTPTNNTPAAPALFPPADPGGAASFAVEREAPLVNAASPAGAYGVAFAHAFGLPLAASEQVAAVEHLDNANINGEPAAAAMNQALWPATLRYFLQQLMAPQFDPPTVEAAREFWVNHIRPGGPLPAFRVGNIPYGILPAVSLDRLDADSRFTPALRALRDSYFLPAAASAPRITPDSADPDGDLLKVLAVEPSSRALRMRILLGLEFTSNTANLLGAVAAAVDQGAHLERALSAATLLNSVNLAGQPRIGGHDGGPIFELIRGPFVTRAPLSEQYGLDGADGTGLNYIQWLHDNASNHEAIKNDGLPGTSRPLLYRLLRHSLLLEMDRIALSHLLAANVVSQADQPERELVGMTTADAPLTAYARIDQAATDAAFVGSLAPYLGYLATLARLPTAELERRFGETLDACSHRLDAWITAAATDRLSTMRQTTPSGCYLGGFGFVENVRPAAPAPSPGGFIHAPSAAHAGAAAILRNGFISRGGAGSAYDIDLSSARVRAALTLIDGVRQGEPLDALLGQALERDLHEQQLDLLIAPLRGYFPLVAGKTSAGDGPTELVAAGNVVDGLALRQARNTNAPPFADPGDLPALTPSQLAGFHAALAALDASVDGLADVLTAESVFQAVRGNPIATAASLDAMAAGVLPPATEVTRTPLSGESFTQRLAIALTPGPAPADGWGAATPRAAAEPALDHWIGTLLGPPTEIGCRVVFPDGSNHDLQLDALAALRPIDLVALARIQPTGLGDSELDRRVLAAVAAPAGAQVFYETTTVAWSLADALELAATIGALLAVARPLAPSDLVPAADGAAATIDPSAAAEAAARAQTAIDELTTTATALDQALAAVGVTPAASATADQLAALRGALEQSAAYGIPGAYPAVDADAATLVTLATWIKGELAKRQAATLPAAGTDPTVLLAAANEAVQTMFGRDFLFLPQLATSGLAAPLAASATLLGDTNAPRKALQQLARVRPNLTRWRSLWIYAQAFGAAAPPLEVVQLPAAAVWAGNLGAEIVSGTLSLILHRPTQAAPPGGWVGIVVDEWTEVVPATSQSSALSFRYESPVAEPPQAVLLAVPPTAAPNWDHDTLLDTVREALTLAKIRVVDNSLLDDLRPFLPAICLTGNTANETVSTDFLGSIVADPGLRIA